MIGLPDDEWGKRVHGVIQPGGDLTVEELIAHLPRAAVSHKVPKTWEFVEALPRDEAGKLRRSALVAERLPAV
ncbi:MAG: hypothetical protein R2849_07100 [Thermomicrobiales bacterium]